MTLHCTEKNSTRRGHTHKRKGEARRKSVLLADHAVFLRIEKFSEARVFLEESKILVVARMVAILCSQLNGDLKIGHGGIGCAGEAVERGQSVMNMVRFGRSFAGFHETFARVIPAADVHHAD